MKFLVSCSFHRTPLFQRSRSQNELFLRHFDMNIIYHILSKFEIWPFLGFLTSSDILWTRDTFHQKVDVKSVILVYNLFYLIQLRNLTFFGDFWPRVTFYDLETPFIRKVTSRASVWYIIYNIKSEFKIWPFLEIFDHRWPFLTARHLSSQILCPELRFDVIYPFFMRFEIWP